MVLTNAERQARYQQRLRQTAYENKLLHTQIGELERRLNETRRAVKLPEIQLPMSAYGSAQGEGLSMPAKIDGDAQAVLEAVQAIFDTIVADASCELQDYEHRIGCGALDQSGNIQDIVFLRRGLNETDVVNFATVLATKVSTGGSTAGQAFEPEDEDELEDLRRAEEAAAKTRDPTTGY